MIEKIVLDYLERTLDVPVSMEQPTDKRPGSSARYVVIQKTGSGMENYLCQATIAIQSYAPSLYQAAELNEAVKTAMFGIIQLDDVTACRLNSDYEYTDPDRRQPRYQVVFDLVHY